MNSWKKRKQLEKEGYYKWRGNSAWNKFFYSLCYILSIQTPISFLFLLFGGKDGFNVLSYVLLTLVIVGFFSFQYILRVDDISGWFIIQEKKLNTRESEVKDKEYKLEGHIKRFDKELENKWNEWVKKGESIDKIREMEFDYYINKYGIDKDKLLDFIKNELPFSYSASMIADYKAVILEEEEKILLWKYPPANKAADDIKEVKKKYRKIQSEYKMMLYKYEFLLNTFPELRRYVDDERGLLSLADADSYTDFSENYDRTRDYLSDNEYRQLSVTQRNQLALDHYNEKQKSNWVLGTEYEMFCEYLLREKGFITIDYGVKKRLEDLGRDIIAKKGNTTYIIQCKRWSTTKEIHENVICQLYGTTIEYNIQMQKLNHKPTLFDENLVVVPLLLTTTKLSDTAKAFADKLGVRVEIIKMGQYPQIKCNINQGNKIYHLPFDQQYYTTQIDKPGEKYAWTVEEAEKSGFRRAFKWQGN